MSETGKLIDQQQVRTVWEGADLFAALPEWLVRARDTRRISQELMAVVPEFNDGQWELKGCDAGHMRFKKAFWTGLYRLVVRRLGEQTDTVVNLQGRIFRPGSPEVSEAQVEGRLGSENWLAVLPALNIELRAREADAALASLDFMTDAEQSRVFLERSIREGAPELRDLRIATCAPKVVRYNMGSRCTVVYRLGYVPGHNPRWPDLVVAKTYRGDKGQNAYDSMAALWNTGLNDKVRVSQPLAYLPDVKVLVQGPVPEEQTLKGMLIAALAAPTPDAMARLRLFMRKTAAGLAALHSSEVGLGMNWHFEDEMTDTAKHLERLADVLPELGRAAAPLLDRLNTVAESTPADRRVPSHGTFRPAQVLIHGEDIGFIDFDSFCQSEPANDLALFLGTVMSMAMTPGDIDEETEEGREQIPGAGLGLSHLTRAERYDFGAALCEDFLAAYEKGHPVSRRRLALWQALNLFTFAMHGWVKIKVGEVEDSVYLLNRFLAENGMAAP